MAEEAEVELKVDLEQDTPTEEVTYTKAEQRAMDDGWRPEAEWEGEEDSFVGAKEFNFRGELMAKITNQSGKLSESSKKVDELSKALKILGEHQKKTAEVEHKRIMAGLKKEKAIALDENDNNSVVDIDDKIAELKESKRLDDEETKKEVAQVEEQGTPAVVTAWFDDPKNSWYHSDNVLKAVADSVSAAYIAEHGNGDLPAMLRHVSKTVKEEMPHKFGKTAPQATKVTEAGVTVKSRTKKYTKKDLSDDQASVAKTFVDMGVYPNVQAFVDELVKTGDLG